MSEAFRLRPGIRSRAITFENPSGAAGAGGTASSPLGVGRKGSPARVIPAGATLEIASIEGPGVIRHLWLATYDIPDTMRALVIRAYWDGQAHPGIEAPLGDFFGFAHGCTPPYASAVHSVGQKRALNIWLPMPFRRHARWTVTNELDIPVPVFFQMDHTLGDQLDEDTGYLHACFRREPVTRLGADFELLPLRTGSGRYLGAVIGVRPTNPAWWGEGEARIYLDGDEAHPTIVGTGAEDYVCLSWGLQQTTFPYHGANLVSRGRTDTGPVSMYRWHLPDPVYWERSIRVTIQQIGIDLSGPATPDSLEGYLACLRERQDDWSSCTFWYERLPSAPLPVLPALAIRLHDLELTARRDLLPLQPGFRYQPEL